MLVYFLGREECRPKFEKVRSNVKLASYIFYSKIGAFMQAVKECPPQLIFVDFYLYDDDFFCLKNLFQEGNIKIPLLYFDNPKVEESDRVDFWICQCMEFFSKEKAAGYRPLLERVSEELSEKKIEVIEKSAAKPEPIKFIADDFIYRFRKKHNICQRVFFLLQCLYSTQRSMTKQELVEEYKKVNMFLTERAISVYLSRLRQYILQDHECEMDLIKDWEGYRLIVFGRNTQISA